MKRSSVPMTMGALIVLFHQIALADAGKNEFLDLDIRQLMDITVTSVAKKQQSLTDVAAAVYVITQDDIRRSGVTTVADALAMAPGLQVAKISSSKWSVSARGFAGYTSNKLLVLIDGRSVYSPSYSGTFWGAQNVMLEDIDRIEVIRGPGGTVWGTNAVNGVINIITKKAQDTQGGLLRVGAGDQEPFLGAARYGGKLAEQLYGRMYVMYNDHGSNSLVENGKDAGDDWQPLQGGFRLDGEAGSSSEWTLQGDLFKNDINQIVSPFWTDQPPYLTVLQDSIDSRGGNIIGRWRGEVGEGDFFTMQGYYDYNRWEEASFGWEYHIFDVDLQYETKLGPRHNVMLGGGYRHIEGAFDRTFQVFLPDRTDSLLSAFLQDEISLLRDQVWLTLGVKYEHNDYTGSEWQPSARLLWKPNRDHSLWAAVARAVRTPALVERYGRVLLGVTPTPVGPVPITLNGSTDFESEILWAYEAGYRWQARDDLSLDVAVFWNDYDDIYTTVLPLSSLAAGLSLENGMEGVGRGVEVALSWQPDPRLSFQVTYSFLDLDLTVKEGANAPAGSTLLEKASPNHQLSFRSSLSFAENWDFNLWIRYVDQIAGLNRASMQGVPTEVDDYFQVDANIIWRPLGGLEVMLAGQNIVESGQLQYVSEYFSPLIEIERVVYTKLTWRF